MLDVTRQRVSLLSDHSPWNILFGSFDPIGTARGDIYLIRITTIIILFWAHSARSTGFRLDLYPILHLDFILGLFRMLA